MLVSNAAGDGLLVTSPIGADELDYTIFASGAAAGTASGSDYALGTINSHAFALNTSTAGLQTAVFSSATASAQVPDIPAPIDRSYTVLDRADASFIAGSGLNALTIDFGHFPLGSGIQQEEFSLFNLMNTTGYTAALDLIGFAVSGDANVFQTDLAAFQALAAGQSLDYLSSFDTSAPGTFAATYSLLFSDDAALPGAVADQILTLNLVGTVEEVQVPGVPGDFDLDGLLTNSDIQSMLNALIDLNEYQSVNSLSEAHLLQIGDLNGDLSVTNADIQALLNLLTAGPNLAFVAIPEPACGALLMFGMLSLLRQRGRYHFRRRR